ncbi:hypothetical protein ACTXT7_002154 [Hymenolepis weldensis]
MSLLEKSAQIRVDPFAFHTAASGAAHFKYGTGCNAPVCSKRTSSSSKIIIAAIGTGLFGRDIHFIPWFREKLAVVCVHFPKVSSNTAPNRFNVEHVDPVQPGEVNITIAYITYSGGGFSIKAGHAIHRSQQLHCIN